MRKKRKKKPYLDRYYCPLFMSQNHQQVIVNTKTIIRPIYNSIRLYALRVIVTGSGSSDFSLK